jgi:hypothetical protein
MPRGGGQDHTQKPGGQGPGGGQGRTQEPGGGQGRTQDPGGGQRLTQQREQEPPFRGRLLRVAGIPYVGKPIHQTPFSNWNFFLFPTLSISSSFNINC